MTLELRCRIRSKLRGDWRWEGFAAAEPTSARPRGPSMFVSRERRRLAMPEYPASGGRQERPGRQTPGLSIFARCPSPAAAARTGLPSRPRGCPTRSGPAGSPCAAGSDQRGSRPDDSGVFRLDISAYRRANGSERRVAPHEDVAPNPRPVQHACRAGGHSPLPRSPRPGSRRGAPGQRNHSPAASPHPHPHLHDVSRGESYPPPP